MITGNPHMASAGRRNTPLHKIMRGTNPHKNFLSRGTERQRNDEYRSDETIT
jgi:hypothetical protein